MREHSYAKTPRAQIRKRRAVALGAFSASVLAVVLVTTATLGGGGARQRSLASLRGHPVAIAIVGQLPQPVAQAAGAPDGHGGILVIGGVDGAGDPIGSVQRPGGVVSQLPVRLAAAGAAPLAGAVYVFGGRAAKISDAILRAPTGGGGVIRRAGVLSGPIADAPVVTVGRTAFLFGGFDGSRELDGVLAWQPGGPAHRTAHLPAGLRDAAAAVVGGVVIIAGGSSGGLASRSILRFDPIHHRVTRVGELPMALTHAGAAVLDGLVFVVGGRGSAPGSVTRAIYAVDPVSGRAVFAGALPVGVADAAVVGVGGKLLIAGGTNRDGRVQGSVLELALR